MTVRELGHYVVPPGLRELCRLARDPVRRDLFRARRIIESRPQPPADTVSLFGFPTRFTDGAAFLSACKAIFVDEVYRFSALGDSPRIIDCGANIGLALLYWTRLFPKAQIVAFEPDPVVFAALKTNCTTWQLADVRLVERAVWTSAGVLPFASRHADDGHLLPAAQTADTGHMDVRTVRLRDYLAEPTDLLKIDIEGAETEVLLDCQDALAEVERVFVEYHSKVGEQQRLDEVLRVLRAAGFRVHIQPELVALHPFEETPDDNGMDHRLNVFAFRGDSGGS